MLSKLYVVKFTHPAGRALSLWVPWELHVRMGSSLSTSLTRFSLTEIIVHLNSWLLKSILIFIYRRHYGLLPGVDNRSDGLEIQNRRSGRVSVQASDKLGEVP